MNSLDRRRGGLLPVLLTGVCVAACGLYAADGSTTNPAQKPAPQKTASSAHPPAAHPAAAHPVAPKPGAAAPSHTTATKPTAPHPAPSISAAKKTATPAAAGASRRTPARTVAARKGASAHTAGSNYRYLNGYQRLARLRLQPDRIQEIQGALIREGYLQGEPNGQWDARTHDAMMHYQTDHGFPPTGLPEAKSLMKLGLGSHPLPAELDHAPAGVAGETVAPGSLTIASPTSQVVPPASPSP